MKFLSFLIVTALCAITFFSACGNEGDAARDAAVESAGGAAVGDQATAPNPATPTPEPPQNADGVWHYTCPKGCAGGAGSAVPCPACGTTLAHNTAYHASNTPATTPTTLGSPDITPITPPVTPTAEPPQNAAGVWHYTCPAGCAGGAGSAVACSKCGQTLAHNTAYHQ